MSHTSRAASTSAVLSATSSFTLFLLLIKYFLALAAKPSLRCQLLWFRWEAAISQWPHHQANLLICVTCDETHQCLKQSYSPCHHLPAPSADCSLAPSEAGECWPLSFLHCYGIHAHYCTGAGKLLGTLMSWGRDGGLSTDSNAPTVETTWIKFAILKVPPFPSLPPLWYFVPVDNSLNAAFNKTTVASP